MKVDLTQGEHAVLSLVALVTVGGAVGGERRDVDALDLLGVVGGQSVDLLLLGEATVLELCGGTVGVGDLGLEGVDGTVGVLAVQDLNIAQNHRVLELEVHRGRKLHVLGQLAVHVIVVEVPLELEVVIRVTLLAVEEAIVLLALDELLNVGAIVSREDIVRHRDAELLLRDLLQLLGLGILLGVVEVDLADGEHLGAVGLLRRNVNALDLLALVLSGDLNSVGVLLAGAEGLLGAILEEHGNVELFNATIAALAVANLDITERTRLLELEVNVNRKLHVLGELAVDIVGLPVPQELEYLTVNVGLGAVEQVVIALLLNELLNIGPIVRGEVLVGNRDVEVVTTKLLHLRKNFRSG